jgi:hypothetical protein
MFGRRRFAELPFAPTAPVREEPDPAGTAWRIHDALTCWAGQVDVKASFALTIESAVLAGVIALSQNGRRLDTLHGRALSAIYGVGIVMLGAGILAAATVVMPRLSSRKRLKQESSSNYIYFGHLRHWTPGDLETALRQDDVLPSLTRAVVAMSQHTWKKYRRMQLSLIFSVLGIALITIVLLVNK